MADQQRRKFIAAALLATPALFAADLVMAATGAPTDDDDSLSRDRVLRDPDIPAAGNANGDITIVEFFDYQCPYCKSVHPALKQAVTDDGKVRLIYKNWPIFGGVSIYAGRMALAARYQNKYAEAHEALITAPDKLDEARVQDLMAKAGIDMKRITQDLQRNGKTIDATLARTHQQADAFGFQGTPAFIFGTFQFSGILDAEGFKAAIADARKASKAGKGK
jgi:protein-disulfide isomerase